MYSYAPIRSTTELSTGLEIQGLVISRVGEPIPRSSLPEQLDILYWSEKKALSQS